MNTRKNTHAVSESTADDKTGTQPEACPTRRRLLGAVTAGGTAAVAVWHRPVIDSVLLPAHAQTTSSGAGAGDAGGSSGGSGGGAGSEGSGDSGGSCNTVTVSGSASEAAGISATSTGSEPGTEVTFYVVLYNSLGDITDSFFVITTSDGSGNTSIALTPADLDATYGVKVLADRTVQISVESACGSTAVTSVYIPGSAAFSVADSTAAGDGGANLASCGSDPGTFVVFTITVKDKSGTPMGASINRNVLVEPDGCTLPLAYTYAELDTDFAPTEPYDICIDGSNSSSGTDTITVSP